MSWQIFLDIAVLVDAQGDMLDNIETQVFFILLLIRPHTHVGCQVKDESMK